MTEAQILGILIITFSTIPWIILGVFYTQIRKVWRKRQNKQKDIIYSVQEITTAALKLQKAGYGATFIIKQNDDLSKAIVDSVEIDAKLSAELLVTVFQSHKSPLHDGALVVSGSKVDSASAFITNISQKKLPRNFGTRHRSALGLTEITDAIAIVLSEETKKVTIFNNGEYTQVNDPAEIRNAITKTLFGKENE